MTMEMKLLKRKAVDNLRELLTTNHLIDFASNDYLGLAQSQHLASLVLEEWKNLVTHLTQG